MGDKEASFKDDDGEAKGVWGLGFIGFKGLGFMGFMRFMGFMGFRVMGVMGFFPNPPIIRFMCWLCIMFSVKCWLACQPPRARKLTM